MLSQFDYIKPVLLEEALEYLATHTGTKVLAGGTDLMVLLRRNLIECEHILDIKGIEELSRFDYEEKKGFYIGAAVTVNQISDHPIIHKKYTALKEAADWLASYQLRNRATLVGNICNASPGADFAGPLLVYNAVVHIAGVNGKREIPLSEFFVGVKKTALMPEEIVIGVSLPDVLEGDKSVFLKQARIKGHDLGISAATVRKSSNGEVLIGMTAVAPTPIRLYALETALEGKEITQDLLDWVTNQVSDSISPISDMRSSKEYRLHVSGVLVKKGLSRLFLEGGH